MVMRRDEDIASLTTKVERMLEGMEREKSLLLMVEMHLAEIERRGLQAIERIERHLYAATVAAVHAANPRNLTELAESIAIVERLEASQGGQG